jgi:hypothetical protein
MTRDRFWCPGDLQLNDDMSKQTIKADQLAPPSTSI